MENQGYCRWQDYRVSTKDSPGCGMDPPRDYRQIGHDVGSRAREVELSKTFGFQMSDTKLFTLLGSGVHID